MKKILGLDLGTNSIGWAVVTTDEYENPFKIEGMGSRIIPMGSDKIDYEKGATITKNADRRTKRSIRRMGKRYKIRRNKLLYILFKLDMLPEQIQFKTDFPEPNKIQNLELLPIKKNTIQLDSLKHYEMRVKALHEKIELQELGKILYQYNRMRGYSGGGEDDDFKKEKLEEDENRKYEVRVQKFIIKSVEKSDSTYKVKSGIDKGSELPIYNIIVFDDDTEIIGTTKLQNLLDKIDSEIELEIRIKRTKKSESIEFALPQKTNWRKQMEATDSLLKEKNFYPCQLFAEDLRNNKWTKIRNRVVLRQQYKREFDAVWEEQAKYYPFLNNCPYELLNEIVHYLFPGQSESQEQLRTDGLKNGLKFVIKEQIIYYQRPIKTQEDCIGECQFEKGEKVIPVSHPVFQEFRCWDQINRLYITSKQQVWNEKKGKLVLKYQNRYLSDVQKLSIYNKLQNQRQVGFNEVAKIVNLANDNSEFLNGLHIKAKLIGCDTLISLKKILNGYCEPSAFLIEKVWDAVYNNVHEGSEYDETSKRVQSISNALPDYLDAERRTALALSIAQNIKFVRKYGSLSKKAIENILPLMRLNPVGVPEKVQKNFENIKWTIETGEIIDDSFFQGYIIDFVKDNPNALEQGGLMYAFASSLVYGRHTKEAVKPQIKNYHDIRYIERNLRNPIVEQLANETMQIVKALWKQYHLNPDELEIRVELARDLKNSAKERENIYKGQNSSRKEIDSIKERLREEKVPVTDLNILKYRLYKQQKFLSPYTKETINFSKLFDENYYNIDHIIPKARYFDDSISNKVICESSINEEKSNMTAWEYISLQNSKYKKYKDGFEIQKPLEYLEFINEIFYGQKKKYLLAEKIPSNPVSRQLKDTQYISVAIKDELAKIVGSEHVKTTTGKVTDYLRSQWGLRKLFMELTEARFSQMELWDLNDDGMPKESWVTKGFDKVLQKNVYEIKGWSKRFDHRHHAIDALVVALSNEKYIKRLNDLNKYFQDELTKRKESIPTADGELIEEAFFKIAKENRDNIMKKIESSRKFDAPFENLVSEAKRFLESMIVSQKPKDKLSVKEDQYGKKQLKIRAALHQETYYGKTNGRDTKTIAISALKAKDIPQIIDEVLKREIDAHRKKYETMREAFTGEGLIAFNESRFQTKNKSAFKPPVYKVKLWYSNKEKETGSLMSLYGDEAKKTVLMGDNYMFIVMEKNGKRVFDIASLYDSVALAKGYFNQGIVNIESIKRKICDDFRIYNKGNNKEQKADDVLFYLQQNDIVYMPKVDDEVLRLNSLEMMDWLSDYNNKIDFAKRLYKVVKFSGRDCFFIPNNFAKEISFPKDLTDKEKNLLKEQYKDRSIPKQELNYMEFGTYSNCTPLEFNNLFTPLMREGKKYRGEKPRKIQDFCVKIKTDWLGNVIEFNGLKL